ncbi:hypothetical protein C8R44DRAFT_751290 [Mycena epipterygia]|nr:hypothetical protein C8R44DRAFT_751290 [Mycena epipterygia]
MDTGKRGFARVATRSQLFEDGQDYLDNERGMKAHTSLPMTPSSRPMSELATGTPASAFGRPCLVRRASPVKPGTASSSPRRLVALQSRQGLDKFCFDQNLPHVKPTAEDLKLFRSGLKIVVRSKVAAAHGLVVVMTLKNPTPESINTQLEENRARMKDILEHILTMYWFGSEDNGRAFYFKDMMQVELITLAFIVAVLCSIEEWSTGRWVHKEFSHKNYFKAYKGILAGLKKWMAHLEKTASNKPEEDAEEEDLFSLDKMFALVE